jgi:hypothetical protein
MSTLYWINVLGNLNDVCMIIFVISALLGITFFLATIFHEGDIKEDLSKVGYKRFVKVRNTNCIVFIISTLLLVFLPTRNQLYIICGVGGTLDYLKENPTAKELPDKCIKALDTWVDNLNKEGD